MYVLTKNEIYILLLLLLVLTFSYCYSFNKGKQQELNKCSIKLYWIVDIEYEKIEDCAQQNTLLIKQLTENKVC
jgi:hypothetical protein